MKMSGKLLYYWRSDDIAGLKRDGDVFNATMKELCGRWTVLKLKTGKRIEAILIASDKNVLAVRTIFDGANLVADLSLIPLREIVSVAV